MRSLEAVGRWIVYSDVIALDWSKGERHVCMRGWSLRNEEYEKYEELEELEEYRQQKH